MFSFYIIILYAVLAILKPTRKVALALTPWLIFACSYDWMRLLPNYEVNPIDVKGLYESEKTLFGINADGTTLIPCEYFAIHHCVPADIMEGLKANFEGECTEVGMYLAMARAAHREGYPEIGL